MTRMSSALSNRFTHITVEPDLEDWCKWAVTNAVEPVVIAFLCFRPELLHKFDRNTRAFPSPRFVEFRFGNHCAEALCRHRTCSGRRLSRSRRRDRLNASTLLIRLLLFCSERLQFSVFVSTPGASSLHSRLLKRSVIFPAISLNC
jgi:hypothetical protein